MSSKFEQLLDYLVNEEQEKANELFHEIVVEKSREIYESLIAEEEEESMEEARKDDEEDEDDSVDEGFMDEEETTESIYGEEDENDEFPVQDQTDDFEDDTIDHAFGGEMGDEMGGDDSTPADKGDIRDLEDALEELKAEFEALLAAEQNEEENEPGIHGEPSPLDTMDDEESDEEEADADDDEDEGMTESRRARSQSERMREYIEKVSVSMVDGEGVGSGRGDKAGQTGHDSGKSPISSGSGKPQSGANAKNIVNDTSKHTEDGNRPTGKVGGLVKSGGDFVKSGTKNVASSANAKKPDGAKLSSVSKPGNKEFAGVGAATGGDKAGQTGSGDTKSPLSGAPNRAK